jgi:hypothetical protein
LRHFGHCLATQFRQQGQTEVEPGGDTATGHPIAVHDDPAVNAVDAERLERVIGRPMGRCSVAIEGARRRRESARRGSADRGHIARRLPALCQEGEDFGVLHHRGDAEPAWHEQHIEIGRTIGKGGRRYNRDSGVAQDNMPS